MARGSPDWKELAPQKTSEQLLREGNGFGGWTWIAAGVAQYSVCQLWNPAASGVEAYVFGLSVYAGAAQTGYMSYNNAALTTKRQDGNNRKLGLTASDLECRGQQMAIPSAPYTEEFEFTGGTYDQISDTYIWIPAGYGLIVFPAAVNTACRVNFKWFEFTEY